MSFDSSNRLRERESSSQKVSQIFDSYMNSIMPKTAQKPPTVNSLPSFAPMGKENSFTRSNYHKQSFCLEQSNVKAPLSHKSNQSFMSSSPGEQAKLNRCDSSSVLAMKALQTKLTDQEQINQELKAKQNESQANLDHIKNLYSQLQSQYAKLESEHRELIPILTRYQQDILQMKSQKEKQMKELSVRFEEQLQYLKRESEKSKFLEIELVDHKKLLEESLNDLKKERQNTQKLKQEFRQQMDKYNQYDYINRNDKQFEEQIEYYHKTNSQLQEQVQKMITAEAKCQSENYQLQKDLAQQKNDNQKLIQENKELKTLYEEQLNYLEKDVKKVFEEQKSQIASLTNNNDQEAQLKREIERLQQQVANLTESSNTWYQKLEKEQIKNSQLELQLAQQAAQFKGANQNINITNKKNKTEEPSFIPKQDQSSEKKILKINSKIEEESVFSYEEKSSVRDQEYTQLLHEIIEVEQIACSLNYIFLRFTNNIIYLIKVSNSDKNDLKQQMNEIMNKIKTNNSKLYDLKSKEFFLLSQSVS